MAHELHQTGEFTHMAFNTDRGLPWHKLGVPVTGLQSVDAMISAARITPVETAPVWAMTSSGMVQADGLHATVRLPWDGEPPKVLGVVTDKYRVVQDRDAVEFAVEVVAQRPDAAVIDTIGLLRGGRQMFAYINLPVLDVFGEQISQGALVINSHDGSQALGVYATNVRAVCANTVTYGVGRSRARYAVKHTGNVEARVRAAREALGMIDSWAEEFTKISERLLRVNDPGNLVEKAVGVLFGKDASTDRQRRNRDEIIGRIKALYDAPTNDMLPRSGYRAYQAIIEWLDWERPYRHQFGPEAEARMRARAALNPTGVLARQKAEVLASILG